MEAVVFHGIGDIRLDDTSEPRIEQPTDAIVRLTASAICGTGRGAFTHTSYNDHEILAPTSSMASTAS